MKKILLSLILLFSVNSFAVSEDTRLIIELVKSVKSEMKTETKANRDLIILSQKRLDAQMETIKWGFGLIFIVLIGQFWYLIKDRKEISKEVKEDLSEKLELKLTKKADLDLVEDIIKVLEKFGNRNSDIANILEKHNLKKV
jgi:hypothetical protein